MIGTKPANESFFKISGCQCVYSIRSPEKCSPAFGSAPCSPLNSAGFLVFYIKKMIGCLAPYFLGHFLFSAVRILMGKKRWLWRIPSSVLLLSFRLKRCANATRFKLEAPYPQLEQICKIVASEPAALPAARTVPLHSACFPSCSQKGIGVKLLFVSALTAWIYPGLYLFVAQN